MLGCVIHGSILAIGRRAEIVCVATRSSNTGGYGNILVFLVKWWSEQELRAWRNEFKSLLLQCAGNCPSRLSPCLCCLAFFSVPPLPPILGQQPAEGPRPPLARRH